MVIFIMCAAPTMTPFDVLNQKPTFSEFLELRLKHDPGYFLSVVRQNYTLGEVIVYGYDMPDGPASEMFRALADFVHHIRVVDGLEICTSHKVVAVFLSEPLIYVTDRGDCRPEVQNTVTLSDIHSLIASAFPFLVLAGSALTPVYTSISESIGMHPTACAHDVDGEMAFSSHCAPDSIVAELRGLSAGGVTGELVIDLSGK